MDDDIRFGEVEEAVPQQQLRPDQNKHYAVVEYQRPGEEDLPIYIDVDALRDMESHATSNTSVELGGVLLGGQYVDDEGRPFVVVTDALRAQHYESTKGSFKFTHETWSTITGQRDEFPDDIQMVGWYHTHPGWGVFLSGMDTFICDHFFSKPQDVALVIDPCQSERGFFQWNESADETRRTGGFYVTGSRFRLPELELYTAHLEGRSTMSSDPRFSGLPGGYPAPIIQIAEPKSSPLSTVALLGMLTVQFLLVGLLAWRMLGPQEPAPENQAPPDEMAAERAMLDRIIGDLAIAPDGVVQSLETQREENQALESVNVGLLARVRELEDTTKRGEVRQESLLKINKEQHLVIEHLKDDRKKTLDQIKDLESKLATYEETPDGDAEKTLWGWVLRWKWYLGGAAAIALIGAAVAYSFLGQPPEPTDDESTPAPPDEAR